MHECKWNKKIGKEQVFILYFATLNDRLREKLSGVPLETVKKYQERFVGHIVTLTCAACHKVDFLLQNDKFTIPVTRDFVAHVTRFPI